jgi:cellulose synthase/poly-beta-1,6-N-acetylglucosamine synthase-like glycosyltransferase
LPDEQPPFCSVIVPTRGRPEQLAGCLGGLRELNYPEERLEVIVMDDVEGDGPAAMRNRGAERAGGELLAFTDDDCRPERSWLRALAGRWSEDPSAAVGGRTANGLPGNVFASASQTIVELVYAHYNRGTGPRFFASNNLAVPADGFREVGGFDESFRTSEDREFCDRWLRHGRRLAFADDAILGHAPRMGLSAFVQRHFRYGRGAFRYHRSRSSNVAESVRRELGFYRSLPAGVRARLANAGPQAPALGALLVAWQLANAAGFAWEALEDAAGRAPPLVD